MTETMRLHTLKWLELTIVGPILPDFAEASGGGGGPIDTLFVRYNVDNGLLVDVDVVGVH